MIITKRVLSVIGLMLPIFGCGSRQHEVEEKYFVIATNIKLPYWQAAAAGMTKAATELHVNAEFSGPDTYDPKAQHEEFQRVLNLKQKPTGILISAADPDLMKGDIDAAIAQGIPVITIDSDSRSSKRLFFIGTDNYKAGVMGGQVALKQLQGKGNVVVFGMPEQANLNERLRGYHEVFDQHPQIKIAPEVNVKGDPRVAFDRTMEIVDKGTPKADAFVCLEATACPEVAEVLSRKKVTGKVVVAMDTDQRTLEGIQKGLISATIGQKPFTMAFVGVKMLDDLHHHKLPNLDGNWAQDSFSPLPTFVDTGATFIDKSNVDVFMKAQASATAK